MPFYYVKAIKDLMASFPDFSISGPKVASVTDKISWTVSLVEHTGVPLRTLMHQLSRLNDYGTHCSSQ
jgi:hypothetical protein